MTGMAPEYLGNKFIFRGNVSGRATRSSQQLNIQLFKTKTGQRSFSHRIVNTWNNLPSEIKLSISFKRLFTMSYSFKLLFLDCDCKLSLKNLYWECRYFNLFKFKFKALALPTYFRALPIYLSADVQGEFALGDFSEA